MAFYKKLLYLAMKVNTSKKYFRIQYKLTSNENNGCYLLYLPFHDKILGIQWRCFWFVFAYLTSSNKFLPQKKIYVYHTI